MDLGNLVETIVHCLLIGEMTCISLRDGFSMVSALVCMVTYWTGLMVNRNIRLLIVMIHQATILHGLSIYRGY